MSGPNEHVVETLFAALRSLRAQGVGVTERREEAVEALLAALAGAADEAGRVGMRIVRRALYVNEVAVANDVDSFVFHDYVLEKLTRAGVGALDFSGTQSSEDLEGFLSLLLRYSSPDPGPSRFEELARMVEARRISGIEVRPAGVESTGASAEEERRAAAKRTYEESVAVARELFDGTRMGRSASVEQVKHAVQQIVDGVLVDEAALGGLSTLKDYDDYAFTHGVNVCIFCVAIGRRLGLTKAQLYDLGHAALVHDVGMSRIPKEILTKGSALTPEERRSMEAHTWLGALSVFELRDFGEIPLQSMLVAFEHHLQPGGGGYPALARPREPSVFAKIVAVAATFDAATNERAYSPARPADQVLRELFEDRDLGLDPVIVKALVNLLGIYPVGTVVILDTYELAIVHSANHDPSFVHRPVVRLVSDADGRWLEPSLLVDLADTEPDGTFSRSIIKVTDPARYGIKVSDYFV